MDCQGLVARLVMDFVLLTTAVEVAGRWRELAERLTKVSRQQMDAYEAPHRDKNGVVDSEVHNSTETVYSAYLHNSISNGVSLYFRPCVYPSARCSRYARLQINKYNFLTCITCMHTCVAFKISFSMPEPEEVPQPCKTEKADKG